MPSRRWWWVLWAYAGLVACCLASSCAGTIAAVAGHHIRLDSAGDVLGTQHIPGWLGGLVLDPDQRYLAILRGFKVLSWRQAVDERRQQLKWPASGVVVTLGVGVVASSLVPGAAGQVLSMAIAASPVSIGVGILKYRLPL